MLRPGDRVALTGTILNITSEQPTYCNILFRADEAMAPEAPPYDLSLSARMVEKIPDDKLADSSAQDAIDREESERIAKRNPLADHSSRTEILPV